jgi:hypothetical protein
MPSHAVWSAGLLELGTRWLNRPPVLIHSNTRPVGIWTNVAEGICGTVVGRRLPNEWSASGITVYTGAIRIGLIWFEKRTGTLCNGAGRPTKQSKGEKKDNAHEYFLASGARHR